MNMTPIRRPLAWVLIFLLSYGQALQAATLNLATTPLAATTTSVVRPNLMYVLDDSGSMAWDYTPDYINDATVTDPTNAGITPPGSAGDRGVATVSGGVITAINAVGGNIYEHGTPTVLIQGAGTGAAATVTLAANKTIASVNVSNGGTGYVAATTYVTFLGGLKTAAWGMCWGTTGTSNQGGTPKDTSAAPTCTTRSQMPYSTAKVNFQYYDPAVRYLPPLRADGTSYPDATAATAKTDGFAGTGSINLTNAYQHEIWCSVATPSPTPSAANIATHAQCKENTDTTNNALYPNATYTFRKTYNGPAYYHTMEASEYCTSTDYTNCITRDEALTAVPAFVVGGVTYNVPSYYRWCAFYNPISKTFGGCQGRRDLDHYLPNYLGGWVSTGAAGVQSTASLVINATTAGQSLTAITVGGVNVVGGQTFTSAANGDEATVAQNICTAIQANTGGTGYSCAVTGSTVLIQAAAVGDAANGLPVLAVGPSAVAAVNATGEIRVTTATAGLTINSIIIHGNELLSANVTADGDQGNTARMICEAINSGAQQGVYIARSGSQAGAAADTYAYGTCQSHADAYVQVKRVPADNTDNGQAIVISGPATATISSGSIQINSTAGATSISDVTKDGVSIFTAPALAIADGTQTTSIATSLAAKINGNGGCTATASGNLVTITGCIGVLAVASGSTQATGTIKVTSTGHNYGADLGGIQVGATGLAGHITATTLSNGTSVAANASALRTAINAGTGTHGFSAAAPVASGSDYNLTVTAPVGTAYNGQSFTFQPGTAVVAGAATSPVWNFSITNATKDDAIIDYLRCDPSDSVANDELYILSTDATTGSATTNNLEFTTALANGLNSSAINGYTYSCAYDSGTQNDQICNVTGPTGVSACISDLSFTKDGTITTKNYSKLTAGSAGCGAITAPTWTFRLSDSVDNDTITSITCGGTNTITPNTVAAGNGNGDSRRGLLASGMNSNDTNGYTYSCSNDTSADRVNCTVTGPTAAAACTNLQFTKSSAITLDFNNNVSQACPAITTGTSATWRFTIDNATSANKLFNSITCGGVNTITTNTVSTGTASNTTVARINNLKSTLEANDANGYNISCTTATSGTAQSDCTVTGPTGANACQGTDNGDSNNCGVGALSFKYDGTLDGSTGIVLSASGMTTPRTADYVRACVPASSNGSSGATAVDDYAPFLFTLSTFAGGAPSQGTTITPIASNDVGTIGTTTVAMANGTAPSVLTISTNATGTAPNVLTMGGGSNPNTATNHWTGTGIFKRVDVVSTNNSYSRASGRTDCAAATCTYTEELQNFANWYSYYRTRMLMMKSATTLAFTQLDGNYRVGFDNICQATGTTVDNPVAQFEGAGRTSWWTSLTSASPNCATPLRAETAKIGQYYARKLNATQADPIEYSCQQNYMLLVTDGYWNETESSAIKGVSGADIGNTDNALATAARPYYDGAQVSTSCPAVGGSRGSTAYSCRTLADIAFHYYSTDLRTNALGNATNTLLGRDVATNNVLTTADDKNQAQHMNFFAMGLGIDGKLGFSSDYQTSGLGDYAAIVAGTKDWPAVANLDPTGVDDLWHATVSGRGKYFSARNVPNVVAGLREALNKIGARVGSAAAAATSNLEPVAGDNFAYVASYTTLDWTGDLQSRSIDVVTGEVSSSTACTTAGSGCQWSAQAKLDNNTWSARRIFVKPTSGTSGDPLRGFNYDNLTGAEQAFFNPSTLSQYAALSISNASDITASNLVNFLRGNRGLEQDGDVSHAQIWRRRSHVLGDIVNTQPIFMKAPNALYADAGYSSFKSTNASRQPVVFVSAQDGMLHAFNAHTSSVTVSGTAVQPGEEMWAFVPSQAMETMKLLGDVNYAHRYFVDGQITIADVDFGGGNWHTILVGGQGAGGRSYFALDVTNPTSPKYLWEFSDANLGNTFSNAAVSKLHSGEWAVMFSSGYNNTANGGDGIGHLFALNPETGAAKTGFPLSTGSGTGGSPSNLGKLSLWADNPGVDNTAQYIYAGDTNGDLWRFDLDPSGTGHTGTAVFKLAHLEVSSIPLPITTKPELSSLADGTRLIMVGTGKYLESTDLTNTDVQSFFAVKDTLGAANLAGASQETWNPVTDTLPSDATQPMFLQRKLIANDESNNPIAQTDASGVTRNFRMVCAGAASSVTPSGTAPNLSYSCNNEDTTSIDLTIHGGWYALFPDTGERMNVDPRLVRGTLVFATNIPAADSCTVGGRSWANFLDYQTGLAVAGQTFTSTKISDSLVVGITVIRLQSGDYKAIATKSNYQQETLAVPIAVSAPGLPSTPPANTFQSKRGMWREFEAY